MPERTRRSYLEAPADYPQSRAAQRELYGARRIDASTRYADPATNIGAVGSPPLPGQGLTSKGAWDKQFKPKFGASPATAALPAGAASGPASPWAGMLASPELQAPGFVPGMPEGWSPGNRSALPALAAGGTSHTERWSGGVSGGSARTAADTGVRPMPFRNRDNAMPAAPFMPQGWDAKFTVPKALTSPEGSRRSDVANLAANRGMNAPGGASGFWGGGRPPAARWQGPSKPLAAGQYTSRYGTASVSFDKLVKAGHRWGSNSRAA